MSQESNQEVFSYTGQGRGEVPKDITEVHVRKGVNKIGYGAFAHCKQLGCIKIPSTIESIGECAFYCCSSLTHIDLSTTSIKEIPNGAFEDCEQLTYIKIPSSIQSIGEEAFKNCSSLAYIDLSATHIKEIPKGAFFACKSLAFISLPATIESIGHEACCYCKSLTSIDLPAAFGRLPPTIKSIGDEAFYGCSSLPSISLPFTFRSIGYGAFTKCRSLNSITIPIDTQIQINSYRPQTYPRTSDYGLYSFHRNTNVIRSNWWLLYQCIEMRKLVANDRASVRLEEVERRDLGIVHKLIVNTCDDIFRTVLEMAKEKSVVEIPIDKFEEEYEHLF